MWLGPLPLARSLQRFYYETAESLAVFPVSNVKRRVVPQSRSLMGLDGLCGFCLVLRNEMIGLLIFGCREGFPWEVDTTFLGFVLFFRGVAGGASFYSSSPTCVFDGVCILFGCPVLWMKCVTAILCVVQMNGVPSAFAVGSMTFTRLA